MSPEISVFVIIFFAMIVQSLAGFGSALIAMPLLVGSVGLMVAAPMFAIIALFGETIMIARHRKSSSWGAIWRLIAASLVGIPIGVVVGGHIPEMLTKNLLGVFVVGYALYSLSGYRLPPLHLRWSFIVGFVAGILTGAYNTGGPPYVVYGTSQGWEASEFKGNLQTIFLTSSTTVIIGHTLSGRVTPEVIHLALIALPAVIIGMMIGFSFEGRVSPARFRTGVMCLLVLIGLSLIF